MAKPVENPSPSKKPERPRGGPKPGAPGKPAKAPKAPKPEGGAKPERRPPGPPAPPPRLFVHYGSVVVPMLRERFARKNALSLPRLEKIVVSMGVGKAVENKTRIEQAVRDLSRITGRKPIVTLARKSISGFKLRQGMPVGAIVTLRRATMWEFLDRIVSIILPRIRDFRGLARKLDGTGNYSLGITEQTVFPEIRIDEVEFVQGMNVTLVTTAKTDEEAFALLEGLGLPFRKAS
jgi:large subunit ribosomal protein L5